MNIFYSKRRVKQHFFSKHFSKFRHQLGFTLSEILIVIMMVGVLAAIAVPNVGRMVQRAQLTHSVTELRHSLQTSQRQAIRRNENCEASIVITHQSNRPDSAISGNCLSENNRMLNGIQVASNIIPVTSSPSSGTLLLPHLNASASSAVMMDSNRDTYNIADASAPEETPNVEKYSDPEGQSPSIKILFNHLGTASFEIHESPTVAVNADSSGKVVAYIPKQEESSRCLAISQRIGLVRIGKYQGDLDSAAITDGVCTALDWKEQ